MSREGIIYVIYRQLLREKAIKSDTEWMYFDIYSIGAMT